MGLRDKDGAFLDKFEDEVHQAWLDGDITNTFRNFLFKQIQEMRDWL